MSTNVRPSELKHPYVTVNPGIRKETPIIARTRTKVIDIAIRYEFGGMTPDEIIQQFPHLTLAQIHDALSYYYENKLELDNTYKKEEIFLKELRNLYPSKLKTKSEE